MGVYKELIIKCLSQNPHVYLTFDFYFRASPGWKEMRRHVVFGRYYVFWRYTAHYTRLTMKLLAVHAQVRTY